MTRKSEIVRGSLLFLTAMLLSFSSWSCHDPEEETPEVLTLSGVVSNVSGFGGTDGCIDLTVNGGTQPYSFQWSTGATSEDIANLPAGSFVVVVSDAGNQEASDTFIITQPEPNSIVIDFLTVHPSATGFTDGTIDITVSGGCPPYAYLWSTGSTDEDITGAGAGGYSVTVTDSENQTRKAEIALSDSLMDYDGNRYSIVKIGEQFWMGENLRVTHAPDGSPVTGYAYGNDENKATLYGRLYTWDVAMNETTIEESQGICPCDWHVPSDEEFKILEMALGMTEAEADMENTWRGSGVGTSLISGGASGYNAVLAGRRSSAGDYYLLGAYEYMWTSTEYGSNAWRRCLDIHSDLVGRWNTFPKSYGFSVRCVKDN